MVTASPPPRHPVVWVTRPEPGNAATCRRLSALGGHPIAMPLTKTIALPMASEQMARIKILADRCHVVATSAAAFRHMPEALFPVLAKRPLHAVGHATAQAALSAGFSSVTTGGGDVAALGSELVASLRHSMPVVYLAGRVRRPHVETFLAKAGFDIETIEVYDTIYVSQLTNMIDALEQLGPPTAILLHSAASADRLAVEFGSGEIAQHFENTDFICISKRVASALDTMATGKVHIADRPDEDAMIAAWRVCLKSRVRPNLQQ